MGAWCSSLLYALYPPAFEVNGNNTKGLEGRIENDGGSGGRMRTLSYSSGRRGHTYEQCCIMRGKMKAFRGLFEGCFVCAVLSEEVRDHWARIPSEMEVFRN